MKRPERVDMYAVYWAVEGVLKIGQCCRASRYRELCATGGDVVFLMRDVPARWEYCALAQLDEFYQPAFASAAEAESILPRGRGFTECFAVAPDDLWAAVDQIYEGIVRYGDDAKTGADAGGVRSRGVVESAAGGAVDGDRAAAVCGRSRPGEGECPADAGEAVPVGRGQVGADGGGASADARRCRVSGPVRPGWGHVLCADRLADCGQAAAVTVPADATLDAAITALATGTRSWVSVVDNDGKVVGIVGTTDVINGYRMALQISLRQLGRAGRGTVLVEETVGPEADAVGKAVHELNLPPGTVFMTAQRANHLLFVSADTVLAAGDHLALITKPANLDSIRSVLGAAPAGDVEPGDSMV